MKLQLDAFGTQKNYIHAFQAVVLFLAWALTIAAFTRSGGDSGGRLSWYFALCWLTIPILIYLTMVPMWSRARRFSNVYAFATLDMLSVVLWLAAWAATASYVSQGKSEGSKDNNSEEKKTGCDNFAYGSAGRCQLATGITILGVVIMLGFAGTSWFSFRALMEYKRTGIVPNQGLDGGSATEGQKYDFQAQTQGDFDTNMRNDDFDDANPAGRDNRNEYGSYGGQGRYGEEYAAVHQQEHSDMLPQEPLSPLGPTPTTAYGAHGGFQEQDTGYGGAGAYR